MSQSHSTVTSLIDRMGGFNIFGPIFGKELILASRRRRTYFLRFAYVTAMIVVLAYSWFMSYGMSRAMNRFSSMSDFGLHMIVAISMYQFFVLTILAPSITGSAIGEEIRKQTLTSLLMTPITSVQIVVGKLCSRMFLLLMLVMASFPLLAVVRVFGGVEWGYILAMEGLTIFSALFAAALSLTFSTFLRKNARDPAMLTFLVLIVGYGVIPGLLSAWHMIQNYSSPPAAYFSWFNPFHSAMAMTAHAFDPSLPVPDGVASPWVQCLLHFVATVGFVLISAAIIRKSALRMAAGQSVILPGRGESGAKPSKAVFRPRSYSRWFVKLSDNRPVFWRDSRLLMMASAKKSMILLGVGIGALIAIYLSLSEYMLEQETHIFFVEAFYLLILGQAASVSASCVSKEKEANTLEILLTTPLEAKTILWEKTLAVFMKISPLVIVMLFHLLVFMFKGVLSPFTVVNILLVLAGPLMFIIGTGVFFSVRSTDARSAVTKNETLAVFLWAPCCPLSSIFALLPVPINPFLGVLSYLTESPFDRGTIEIFGFDPFVLWIFMPIVFVGYGLVALGFFRWATRNFRYRVLSLGKK